ncbi:hypothetical protein ACHQM5_024580 [Ranunculus cassubicifolius]
MGFFPKLKTFKGESSSNNQGNALQSKVNVNEEYLEAFRTKSYIEIWSKVQGQLRTTTTTTTQERVPSTARPPFRTYSRLSENILEPRQEILVELIETSHLHHLLVDYFDGSLEAFRICGSLLQTIDQMRANHRILQRVIKLSKRLSSIRDCSDDQCRAIFNELATFVKLDNPLSVSNRLKFSVIQSQYRLLLHKLRRKCKKIRKRAEVIKICKKASAISLVVACATVSVVTLVLAIHSLVGVVAAPAIITLPIAMVKKVMKSAKNEINTGSLTRLGAQLDAAAKGVFFLNLDFDTLSQLMIWLHDEIEYRKSRASMCIKDQTKQTLKDLVKEFKNRESRFLEKLEELEEHVYLCFLNINRFRRLVIEEAALDRQQPC